MEGFKENDVILITNFWGKKQIPAILIKNTISHTPTRSNIWIPTGYDIGSSGYSCRIHTEIQKFEGTEEVKNDVIKQWEVEQLRCNSK